MPRKAKMSAPRKARRTRLGITLKLEGIESEGGLIRLDDFLHELTALREALATLDREINGKSTLYYRVLKLSQNSPARVVIEPVLKPTYKTKKLGNRYGHLPGKLHHRFFETIQFINDDETDKLHVGEPVIDAIAELLSGLGSDFVRGEIANGKSKIRLDEKFKERVSNLLKPYYRSYGSVEGQLLALNLARGNRFYIYPEMGPRSVSCQFPEELFEKAQAYLRKNVRVYGTKFFRQTTGLPFKIAEVDKLELLEPRKPFPVFRPSAKAFTGPPADELVRQSREEWE
jgi:hypothetical protein